MAMICVYLRTNCARVVVKGTLRNARSALRAVRGSFAKSVFGFYVGTRVCELNLYIIAGPCKVFFIELSRIASEIGKTEKLAVKG